MEAKVDLLAGFGHDRSLEPRPRLRADDERHQLLWLPRGSLLLPPLLILLLLQPAAAQICSGQQNFPDEEDAEAEGRSRSVRSPRCAHMGRAEPESSGRVKDQSSPARERFWTV